MGAMFRSLFAAITNLFTGLGYFSQAFSDLGKVTSETVGQYADTAEKDRSIAKDEAEAARLLREIKAQAELTKAKAKADAAKAAATQSQQPQP